MNFVVSAVILATTSVAIAAAAPPEIVTLSTRDGVTQSFLLTVPDSGKPAAAAILFPGGPGNIRLRLENGRIAFAPNNFLVRSRGLFADGGIATAILDTPIDQPLGMDDHFRLGADHAADVAAVVAELRKRFDNIAVFLVGTSRGTVSAAASGRRLGDRVSGVALTATLFVGSRRGGPGLSGFDFAEIRTPLLFVHHADDGCQSTPYRDAKNLAAKYPLITVNGGDPAQSAPCEALSEHGFLGRERETVAAIVNWMLKKPYRGNID